MEVRILKDIFNIFLILSDCFVYHTSSTHCKCEELFPFSYVKKKYGFHSLLRFKV